MTRDDLEAKILARRTIDANGCWIWNGATTSGYGVTRARGLCNDPSVLVHRLSAYLWLDFDIDITSDTCVLHKCDVRPCFNPAHLFFGTRADNSADMMRKGRYRLGRRRLGEENGNRVLTEQSVREIRRLRSEAGWTVAAIAQRFGVSEVTTRQIVHRKAWQHVD